MGDVGAAAFAPALGQTAGPPAGSAAPSAPHSGFLRHMVAPSLPGFEPLASGPTAVTNKSRRNGVSITTSWSAIIPIDPEAGGGGDREEARRAFVGRRDLPIRPTSVGPNPCVHFKNFAMLMLQEPVRSRFSTNRIMKSAACA